MDLDEKALNNFNNSDFNFIDDQGNDADLNNLSESGTYTFRNGKDVIEDRMKAKDVVDTINNEFGDKLNI